MASLCRTITTYHCINYFRSLDQQGVLFTCSVPKVKSTHSIPLSALMTEQMQYFAVHAHAHHPPRAFRDHALLCSHVSWRSRECEAHWLLANREDGAIRTAPFPTARTPSILPT